MIENKECTACDHLEAIVEAHMKEKHPKGFGMLVVQVLDGENSDDE